MAVRIHIEEPYYKRSTLSKKVDWIKKRVPTKEYRVEYGHEVTDDTIEIVFADVTVWSDDAELVGVEYWWHMG